MTGIAVATVSLDVHWHDTYFVIAHFHFIMVGAVIMAFLIALHYWFPKMFGRMYHEGWGMAAAALIVLGFNATFIPQFLLGNAGMPRRYYIYPERYQALNVASTAGASLLAFGFLIVLIYLIYALVRGPIAGDNPWGSRGLRVDDDLAAPQAQLRCHPRDHAGLALVPGAGRGGGACRHLRAPTPIRTWRITSRPSRSRITPSASGCGCSSAPRCCSSPACSSATRSTATSIMRPSTRPPGTWISGRGRPTRSSSSPAACRSRWPITRSGRTRRSSAPDCSSSPSSAPSPSWASRRSSTTTSFKRARCRAISTTTRK